MRPHLIVDSAGRLAVVSNGITLPGGGRLLLDCHPADGSVDASNVIEAKASVWRATGDTVDRVMTK